MKTQVLTAIAVMLVTLSTSSPVSAQSPAGANATKYGVAVVDINYIFKNHKKFRASMEGMKGNFQSTDSRLKTEQQKIVAVDKSKAQYKPGTAEFKQLDEQVVQMKANLQVEVTQKRKGLVEQEAKIYYETYKEVDQAIAYYAKQKNIGVVLRFNGDKADPLNRESILRSINKAVHFQNQVDITPDVLSMLNRAASVATRNTGAPRNN